MKLQNIFNFFRLGNRKPLSRIATNDHKSFDWFKRLRLNPQGWQIAMILVTLTSIFTSCEDVIDIDLGNSTPQLTIDAWVTDEVKTDTIRLTTTQQYFATTLNSGVTGATVTLTDVDDSQVFTYTDIGGGNYVYTPTQSISKLGHTYKLTVSSNGETYEALSEVRRNVPIDSIIYTFEEEELGQNEGYYAEVYARDSFAIDADDDFYWIRAYKWDEATQSGFWLNKPSEINYSANGVFSPGASSNDTISPPLFNFILPIRRGINPQPDEDVDESPYDIGDSVYVELHSIDEASFYFLVELEAALNNGGLFATPLANVPTNLQNTNANSKEKAVGWFGMSLVNTLGKKLEE